MPTEYLWAIAGVACIVALIATIQIGARTADDLDDPVDESTGRETSS